MNVQSADKADSWNSFMRLVAEARSRSQGPAMARPGAAAGPSAGPGPAASAGRTQGIAAAARGGISAAYRNSAPAALQPAEIRVPAPKAKALGSFFDAYA